MATSKAAGSKKTTGSKAKKGASELVKEVDTKETRIVGIGTSAGGLEALKTFFDNVPANCNLSFVIIQHLSPDYKSLMAELLAKNTQLPIYEVENNMEVKPASVYLIPAKKNMMLKDGHLLLQDKSSGHDLNLPIDIFFRSMAEELGEKAICVVLTGTGSDGTHGVRAVKEVGGMVMVQSPETSKFDGMPRSAISTGLVDYILPISEMPLELIGFVENHREIGYKITENNLDVLQEILGHLKKVTNLDFSEYKRPTLVRRISRRMSVTKCNQLSDYLEYLYATPQEAQILYKEFLIGVTKFFRDSEAFAALSKHLEKLVTEKNFNQPLKMWSVACSTGEEAYSLAIMTKEVMEKCKKNLEVKIFATDIDKDSIDIASKGIFPESFVPDVGSDRLKKYFMKKGDQYQVVQEIRKMIIFSHHNVAVDPPFNRMDLVSCRNLLIYLQTSLQQRLLGTFHYSLNLNGLLFLGPSESIQEYKNVFTELDRRWKIFKNTEVSRSYFPVDVHRISDLSWNKGFKPGNITSSGGSRKSTVDNRLSEVLTDTLSEEFDAVSVYVDEHFDILHAQGNLSKYIVLPEMGFTVNLLKMVNDNISVAISTAVRRANQEKEKVFYRGVRMVTPENVKVIDVVVKPFKIDKLDIKTYFLIILLENQQIKRSEANAAIEDEDPATISRIEDLQRELKETKENLQATVEEVETSNEELQATNEELLAANEELQSTNEELQSVNEELHTVNSEHQSKIQELASLNADMDNLLKSTDIGTIFLDEELRIRWFTPAIKEHFNLLVADVGRPISNFSSNVKGMDIIQDSEYVLKTGKQVEKETLLDNGKWFLTRVLPYQDGNYRTKGTVITFVDISHLKEIQEESRSSAELFRALYESSPVGVITTNKSGAIIRANQNAARICGREVSDLENQKFTSIFSSDSRAKITKVYKDKTSGKHFGVGDGIRIIRTDKSKIPVSITAEFTEFNNEDLILWSVVDISDQLKAQLQLREMNETLEQQVDRRTKELKEKDILLENVLESTTAGYWTWDSERGYDIVSKTFENVFGFSVDGMPSDESMWEELMEKEGYEEFKAKLEAHVSSKGKEPFELITRMMREDQTHVWIYLKGRVISWDGDHPEKMVGSLVNITKLKETQLQLANSNIKLEGSLQRLSLKNHELEQIAYVATHDLRAPVLNLLHLSKMLKPEDLAGKNKEVFNRIVASIEQLNGTLDDLINIAALNSEGVPRQFKRINFNDELNKILNALEKQFSSVDYELKVEFKVKSIKYYPAHITSIYTNLLTNALKYRETSRKLKLKVSTRKVGNYVELAITDNGIGIDMTKHKKRLFGMFKQLHAGYDGKGLGLYIVKNQVEALGGEIEVESTPGEGTTFKIMLVDQTNAQAVREGGKDE